VRGREQAAYLFDKRLKKHLSVNDDEWGLYPRVF
jgi:hypothetical protein